MVTRTLSRAAKATVIALFLAAHASAGDTRHMRASEAAAIVTAVEAFKKIYAKPDLRHYSIEFVRHGNELEITFSRIRTGPTRLAGATATVRT
jgi:hypothetical protein